jgi:hypothetical protein
MVMAVMVAPIVLARRGCLVGVIVIDAIRYQLVSSQDRGGVIMPILYCEHRIPRPVAITVRVMVQGPVRISHKQPYWIAAKLLGVTYASTFCTVAWYHRPSFSYSARHEAPVGYCVEYNAAGRCGREPRLRD